MIKHHFPRFYNHVGKLQTKHSEQTVTYGDSALPEIKSPEGLLWTRFEENTIICIMMYLSGAVQVI